MATSRKGRECMFFLPVVDLCRIKLALSCALQRSIPWKCKKSTLWRTGYQQPSNLVCALPHDQSKLLFPDMMTSSSTAFLCQEIQKVLCWCGNLKAILFINCILCVWMKSQQLGPLNFYLFFFLKMDVKSVKQRRKSVVWAIHKSIFMSLCSLPVCWREERNGEPDS